MKVNCLQDLTTKMLTIVQLPSTREKLLCSRRVHCLVYVHLLHCLRARLHNGYANLHANKATYAHAQGSGRARWNQKVILLSKAIRLYSSMSSATFLACKTQYSKQNIKVLCHSLGMDINKSEYMLKLPVTFQIMGVHNGLKLYKIFIFGPSKMEVTHQTDRFNRS